MSGRNSSTNRAAASGLIDGVATGFLAGQLLYKANLLNTLNLFRAQAGHAPLSWPGRGATASQAELTLGSASLVRYESKHPLKPGAAPVLLVFSLVNRPYVLDLLPGRSVVEALQRAGREVWLLDWGTPSDEDNRRGLDHYALELVPRALSHMRERSGRAPHLVGYCMGGALSLLALAGGAEASSLVAMATPVDLHDDGLLSVWTRTPGFDPREVVATYGNAPPHLIQPAFKMLDPAGLSTKLIHALDRIADDRFLTFFLAMEQWLEDSVAFPGQPFIDWVGLYRDNALLQPRFQLGAATLSLADVRVPIFSLSGRGDYITPAKSSAALERATPNAASHLGLEIDGGHIGLATGSVAHKRAWPQVARWFDELEAATTTRPARSARS